MTDKEERFTTEYLKDLNATAAAKRAGYSPKTAYSSGQRLLKKQEIRDRINQVLFGIEKENIAEIEEVLTYLTNAMRGVCDEEVVVVEGKGDGITKACTIEKQVGAKDRLKAAELLGKYHALFTDKQEVSVALPVVIGGSDALEE